MWEGEVGPNIVNKIWRIPESLAEVFIDRTCLNKGKLHLNRRGSSYLANNFKKFVESL